MPDELPNDEYDEYEEYEEDGDEDYEGYADDDPEDEVETYLRDLTEDDVYERLNRVNEFPDFINGLESRFTGNLSQYQSRLDQFEKALSSRTSFDGEKLKAALESYDPKLAETLIPALQEALQVSPLDENTLRPYMEPMQQQLASAFGEQLVMSVYPPETLAEIIPPVVDGRFAPEGQRHKNFIDWYSQQGYQTQQALLSFGAPYVNAIRKFESWEQGRTQERTAAASSKSRRLASGQQPTSQTRRARGSGAQSPEDIFLAAFEEASSEG